MKRPLRYFFFAFYLLVWYGASSQSGTSWLQPSDGLNHQRLWTGIGLGTATYTGFAIGLNQLWYSDYERSAFHLYNDWQEWEHLDKYGHLYNGYFQSRLVYNGSRWAGLDKTTSIWVGMGTSLLFQSTIEVLDGFSKEWGFSLPDMAFNLAGVTLFGGQQALWDEQRIVIKFSSWPQSYSQQPVFSSEGAVTSLKARSNDLFGTGLPSRILKDYNAQTLWLSVNPRSFLQDAEVFPPWLNVAFGVGAQNMFGGYENTWTTEDGTFTTDKSRSRQYYLSMDIDLTRIKTKNAFLKSLFSVFNIIKIPFPAVEYDTVHGWKGHWLHF